ncbi:MAG: 2-hydroxyacid dehydrogenase [Lachnospiraceae bacterium]|nr:2-hydroxyacid dehydrogenase [Lachnospiraceae bacterium]
MAKKIVGIYDLGITEKMMQKLRDMEEYGYTVELVAKTPGEDEMSFQAAMLSVEVNGPEKTALDAAVFEAVKDAEIIVTDFGPVGSKLMDAAPELKLIGTCRTGLENINLEAAKARGVKVVNAPGRAAVAVADFTVGAMICQLRNIARTDVDIKNGGWEKKFANSEISYNMCDYQVGLIGFGDIGKRIAKRLQGFDTTVAAYDPYCPAEVIEACGCKAMGLDELLATSDVVSIHARLTEQTKNMFNAEMFDKMKPTAVFVNMARAELVDEDALVHALQTKKISGAVLDVFTQEPLPADHPLRGMDNVTLSAHLAGTSQGTYSASVGIVTEELVRYAKGEALLHCVQE